MKRFTVYLVFLSVILISLQGCNKLKSLLPEYLTPSTENPYMKQTEIKKSQFRKSDGSLRTFLCGWAAVNESGYLGESAIYNFNQAFHCNVEFEIMENELVGKQVNPSYPNDSSMWEVLITIPIRNHFYLEPAKDQYGRDTNEIIKNSSRSHWSARPYMELDFSGVSIKQKMFDLASESISIDIYDVREIEWDFDKNFFAFTISTTLNKGYRSGQIDYRFNFLEFEHDPNFKKTPYDSKNAKHINVLHVFGKKMDGINSVLYAGKWDLSERHDIYLNDVPEKYVPVVEEVLRLWNEAFIEIGALRENDYRTCKSGFFVNRKKLKYSFDLRYPAITWVKDKRVSRYSPIGIAISSADVRNGKMLWGAVNIYAGSVETYLRRFMPSSAEESSEGNLQMDISRIIPLNRKISMPPGMKKIAVSDLSYYERELSDFLSTEGIFSAHKGAINIEKISGSLNVDTASINNSASFNSSDAGNIKEQRLNNIIENINSERQISQASKDIIADFNNIVDSKHTDMNNLVSLYESENLSSPYGMDQYYFKSSKKLSSEEDLRNMLSHLNQGNIKKFAMNRTIVSDQDVLIADIMPSWRAMIVKEGVDEEKVLRAFYKNTIAHEFGHFFNLGHNFKDNILPDPEKVPSYVYNSLKSKANAENNYTNMSTVMGYIHAYTEIALKEEDVKPGFHDLAVLRYIYKGEYPTFRREKGIPSEEEEFTYFKVRKDGVIPAQTRDTATGKIYNLAYLPACNDFDANFSLDPECNRFDYGSDAETIVESYINSITDNIVQTSVALTDARGGYSFEREFNLSYTAWEKLGRVRLFYDKMRRDYDAEIREISNDEESLYEFSSACRLELEDIKNKKLKDIFTRKPGLKKLCAVNGKIIEKMTGFMSNSPLVDYTVYDFDEGISQGGFVAGDAEGDWSKVFGTWKILTNFPLKIATLATLTEARPHFVVSYRCGCGAMSFYPAPVYSYLLDKDAGYSYSSLYPKEFTEAISKTVENNVQLANISGGYSTVGKSVLNLGYMLYRNKLSNDSKKFSENYISTIRNQDKFNFGLVAVILKAVKHHDYPDRATKFTAKVYDFRSGKEVDASEVYILPGGEIIARAENVFLYPITKLKFFSNDSAYVFAYQFDYKKEPGDILFERSVKKGLKDMHDNLLNTCTVGSEGPGGKKNGLETFFGSEEFKGFKIPEGIVKNHKYDEFLLSIEENFEDYYKSDKYKGNRPKRETCLEAKRGLGLIVSTAALINGHWLPEVKDFIQW